MSEYGFDDDENDDFGGSGDEMEITDHVDQLIEGMNTNISDLQIYLKNNAESRVGNSDHFNIIDRHKGSYFIENENIKLFMKKLYSCVESKIICGYSERQLEYSGIMLDFDIYQTAPTSIIDASMMQGIILDIFELLQELVDMVTYLEQDGKIHFVVLKRPVVCYDDKNLSHKDGIHLLIPGVKIIRPLKRFLVDQIREKIMPKWFGDFPLAEGVTPADVLDKNSAHVNVFFYKNAARNNKKIYDLYMVLSCKKKRKVLIVIDETDIFKGSRYQQMLCWELSINWQADPSREYKVLITKQNFEPFEHYRSELEKYYVAKNEEAIQDGEMRLLFMEHPEACVINELVEVLNIHRATDRGEWRRIMMILAKENEKYKPIARNFSARCSQKFNAAEFEDHWNQALMQRSLCQYSIGTLYYYAKMDNIDLYSKIISGSTFKILYDNITDIIMDGRLQNYTIANILTIHFKGRFKFSTPMGGRTGHWYEFILSGDKYSNYDQVFKWKKWEKTYDCPPMDNYISTSLFSLVRDHARIFQKRLQEFRNDPDKEKYVVSHYEKLYNNLKESGRMCLNHKFKYDCVQQAKFGFIDTKFADILDQAEETWTILGVANGIIRLGKKTEFIGTYHPYPISRYTPIIYKPYDPHAQATTEVYVTLRGMFPDDESDSFEYLMYYMAASLDFGIKDALFMLIVGTGGNGKTTLMNMLTNILGLVGDHGYAAKIPAQLWMVPLKGSEAASPTLADLQFARFAFSSEFPENARLILTVMKELAGAEYIRARRLYENGVTFMVKCLFILLSNYEFEIDGNDDGTWRRIVRLGLKMKFVPEGKFDSEDKYQRISDPNIQKDWSKNPITLSAFLSILIHFYEKLQVLYKGDLNNVPRDHILQDTEAFRNNQDKINYFISHKVVKCSNDEIKMQAQDLSFHYCTWHTQQYGRSAEKRGLEDKFGNSRLGKFKCESANGTTYYRGHRVLTDSTEMEEGETRYLVGSKKKKDMKKETPTQYHQRKCDEFDAEQAN